MTTLRFGVNQPFGTLTECRAKPENRGKGRCKHTDHVEVEAATATKEWRHAYNEAVVRKAMAGEEWATLKKKQEELQEERRAMRARKVGRQELPGEEGRQAARDLLKASEELVAATRRRDNREALAAFAERYPGLTGDHLGLPEWPQGTEAAAQGEEAAAKVEAFLRGEAPEAAALREHLGPEVDLRQVSRLLVAPPSSFYREERYSSARSNSPQRIILSQVSNNMTKEECIKALLYFRCRCCYCGVPLGKQGSGAAVATAEHLTALNSEAPRKSLGTTTSGNMAPACRTCNASRGSRPLTQWLASPLAPGTQEEKAQALASIAAFRQWVGYRPLGQQETKLVRAAIARLTKRGEALREPGKKHSREALEELKAYSRQVLEELKASLAEANLRG